jgi:Mn-dependent DtxR family transcriptional regulator
MVLSTVLKMQALMHIVAEHQNFNDPSLLVNAIAKHIRQEVPVTVHLIEQLRIQGCLDKSSTGMFFPTKKGEDEVARYKRIVEQKI